MRGESCTELKIWKSLPHFEQFRKVMFSPQDDFYVLLDLLRSQSSYTFPRGNNSIVQELFDDVRCNLIERSLFSHPVKSAAECSTCGVCAFVLPVSYFVCVHLDLLHITRLLTPNVLLYHLHFLPLDSCFAFRLLSRHRVQERRHVTSVLIARNRALKLLLYPVT